MTVFCTIRMNSETGMIGLVSLFGRAAEEAGWSWRQKRSNVEVNRWNLEIDFVV
jgi:hypothetical protein